MGAFMSKWIIEVFLLGQSNLQIILRFCIAKIQPCCHNTWGLSTLCLFSIHFTTKGGFKVLYYITMSWKTMASTTMFPPILDIILQLNLWGKTKYQGSHFCITMGRALALCRKGLRYIPNIWDPCRISWTRRPLELKFPLLRFNKNFGSNWWISMDLPMRGCLTNKGFNLLHKNGSYSTETWRKICINGWLVEVTSRNSTLL